MISSQYSVRSYNDYKQEAIIMKIVSSMFVKKADGRIELVL